MNEADGRRTALSRLALLTALALYASIAITVVVAGPDEVVGHFGGGGRPTRLDPTGPFVLTMSLVVAALVSLFAATPALVRRIPIEFVNVPNREKWNTPELRDVLARRVGADMMFITAATVLLMAGMLVLSALGGLGEVPPGWVFPLSLAAYLALIGVSIVQMYRGGRYEPPAPE